jgi:hypothetical protein
MKKNSLIIVSFLAIIAIVFATCTAEKSSGPSQVVKEHLTLINKGEIEQATGLLFNVDETQRAVFTEYLTENYNDFKSHTGIEKIEIISEELNETGMNANLKVKLVYNDGSEEEQAFRCVKMEEDWLIVP